MYEKDGMEDGLEKDTLSNIKRYEETENVPESQTEPFSSQTNQDRREQGKKNPFS